MSSPRAVPGVVWLICGSFATAYSLYSLIRHWTFGTGGYDLGIFDQAMWHMSRLERPASTVSGHLTIFADHFHPVLLSLVPLYWLVPRAETLLVAQSILMAASIVPVFLYARLRTGRHVAVALAVAYGLFWGMQKAATGDFHEVAFAPLFLALAILALETGRLRFFWISALALCLVKEDLIPVLVMFGLRLAALGHYRQGVAAVAIGLLGFVTVVKIVIPAFQGSTGYVYAGAYSGVSLFTAPRQLLTPPEKLLTMLMWIGPFLFLPLRSPLVLIAIPLALSRLLSNNPNHWSTAFHYGAPLAPILAMAAADGMARAGILRNRVMVQRCVLFAVVLLCAILPGRLPLWRVLSPKHYARLAEARTGHAALKTIPSLASVAAQTAIVPHLTHRDRIYVLRPEAPRTEFIIAATSLSPWPLHEFEEIEQILEMRRAEGYRTVFSHKGWTVLQRATEGVPYLKNDAR